MLKKPSILEIPSSTSSLCGGELACSGNTCASGFICNSVDSSGSGGCPASFAVGGIIAGTVAGAAAGAAVGILIT